MTRLEWVGLAVVVAATIGGWAWGKAELDARTVGPLGPTLGLDSLDGNFDSIRARIILVGDGGTQPGFRRPRAGVLQALSDTVANHRELTTVVFLGDNVYDHGMDSANVAATAPRLEPQVKAAIDPARPGVRSIFVPGNHDWGAKMEAQRVRTQARYVDSVSAGAAMVLPTPFGCPGPSASVLHDADGDTVAVLVALDTQWLLKGGAVREATPTCARRSSDEVLRDLTALLRSLRYPAVIVAHHPIWSIGKHARNTDTTQPQDLFSTEYTFMRDRLVEAMRMAPPLIWAGGHDHSLQVFGPEDLPQEMAGAVRYAVVSGALSKSSMVVESRPGDAFRARGFVIVDFLTDGAARLRIVEAGPGQERQLFHMRLQIRGPALASR